MFTMFNGMLNPFAKTTKDDEMEVRFATAVFKNY